jgi:hypothetical protein
MNFLQEKAVGATKQKEEKRKKLKPEEQEGMPQYQHCPPVLIECFLQSIQRASSLRILPWLYQR